MARGATANDVPRSNEGKVFWPEIGLTKGDLLAYLDAVGPRLVRALRDRPLSVKRAPDGLRGQIFYQKNTPAHAPAWLRTVTIPAPTARRDVRYPVCNSERALLWLGNQAAVELHPATVRIDRLDRPDQLVFDLDPPEGGFDAAVEAARLARRVLDDAGLVGALKTSGAKGLHVFVPIRRRYGHAEVERAAERLAARCVDLVPDLVTMSFEKAGRHGRVLIDTKRNAPGQTVVAAYSPRLRPDAGVSFPVAWDDLDGIAPGDFTVRTVPHLLGADDDPWRELLPPPQSLRRDLVGGE